MRAVFIRIEASLQPLETISAFCEVAHSSSAATQADGVKGGVKRQADGGKRPEGCEGAKSDDDDDADRRSDGESSATASSIGAPMGVLERAGRKVGM